MLVITSIFYIISQNFFHKTIDYTMYIPIHADAFVESIYFSVQANMHTMYIYIKLIYLQSCEMSTEFAQSMAKEVDVLSRKMHGRSMRVHQINDLFLHRQKCKFERILEIREIHY